MTGNLGYTQIAAAQNQKEVTANDDFAIFDGAITEKLAVDLTSADATITTTQFQQNMMFEATNNSVARTITVPAVKRSLFLVKNSGTAVLSVTCGTTTLKLGIGQSAVFATDGTANGLSRPGGTMTVAVGISGLPADGQNILVGFNDGCKLLTSLPGSHFAILTNPTSTMTFALSKKSGGSTTSIGSVAFNTSGVASVTFAADISFIPGDLLIITCPSPQDATGADVSLAFQAIR